MTECRWGVKGKDEKNNLSEKDMRKEEKQITSLLDRNCILMEENDRISTAWKEDSDRMRAAFEKDLKEVKAEGATKKIEVKKGGKRR